MPDTRQAAAALGQVVEFNGIELFGTTETGAIAHRQIPSRTDGASTWTLLRDVELVGPRSGEGPLAIRGPRIARPRGDRQPAQLVELDDLVVRDGDRSFTYLGRRLRLIKVNGVRVWLDELEAALRAALPTLDVVCIPKDDHLRGEHFEVYYAVDEDSNTAPTEIRRIVRQRHVEPPSLHQIRRVPRIPRTPTGKVRLTALLEPASADHSDNEAGDLP